VVTCPKPEPQLNPTAYRVEALVWLRPLCAVQLIAPVVHPLCEVVEGAKGWLQRVGLKQIELMARGKLLVNRSVIVDTRNDGLMAGPRVQVWGDVCGVCGCGDVNTVCVCAVCLGV